MHHLDLRISALENQLADRGIKLATVQQYLLALPIETPSWGYGNSGTRFQVFKCPAAAKTITEKIADAGLVNRLTGACPTVALHIPWDKVDDWSQLTAFAKEQGVAVGAINPNLFQEADYRLGSLCHPQADVRAKAVAHIIECIEIAKVLDSNIISVWLPDGTNYPGQDDIRSRRQRMIAALQEAYNVMPINMQMLIEYKLFEPAFYHTDLADWGASYTTAQALGPQAKVLVDTGHHAPGTNIEYIVATLLDLDRLGGFHFNCRKYADDDLIVGSSHPFELFSIFHELINATGDNGAAKVAYMLDQSHNIEDKIEAMIISVMNVQTAYARALCLNRQQLTEMQQNGDVLGAHRLLHEAFETDVTPLLAAMREANGCAADPFRAYRENGEKTRLWQTRTGK